MRKTLVTVAVATALVAAGCTSATAGEARTGGTSSTVAADTGERQVRALFDGWNQALATLDPDRVADRYAPDAVLLPTVSNQVRTNRAEIVDYFVKFLKDKPRGTILSSHVTVLNPNAAIDTGTYRFAFADGRTVEARYTFVYERVGGDWLIVNHHSSAMPEG